MAPKITAPILPFLFLSLLLTFGCSTVSPVPGRFSPEVLNQPLDAWARVLNRNVNESGAIDFRGLASNRQDLNAYVYFISKESPDIAPEKYPGMHAKLAYYVNSYNALAMHNVLESKLPADLGGWMTLKFFLLKSFNVGGRYITLSDYENEVIRPLGEERVHFVLNCMVRGCPKLPRAPFTASNLESELNSAATHFLNEERNVKVDQEKKVVYLSSILKFYTKDFTLKSGTLINYVNRYRKESIPSEYRTEFIPYDWTLNQSKQP